MFNEVVNIDFSVLFYQAQFYNIFNKTLFALYLPFFSLPFHRLRHAADRLDAGPGDWRRWQRWPEQWSPAAERGRPGWPTTLRTAHLAVRHGHGRRRDGRVGADLRPSGRDAVAAAGQQPGRGLVRHRPVKMWQEQQFYYSDFFYFKFTSYNTQTQFKKKTHTRKVLPTSIDIGFQFSIFFFILFFRVLSFSNM